MSTTTPRKADRVITGGRRARYRSTVRLAAACLLSLALVLSACSGSNGDDEATASTADFDTGSGDDTSAGSEESADDMAAENEAARADDGDADSESAADVAGDSLAQPTGLTPADLGRDIIFRAAIAVEVDDVATAGAEATQHIEALGGVVFGQTTVTEPRPTTVLTFKVAPADFDTALDRLAGIGELVDQTITADDVTDRVVDLESRITTAETSVERLRGFLAEATTVQDVAALERELVDRETALETLRGQLRTLRDQVSLATITLEITAAQAVIADAELDVLAGLGATADDACPGSLELETDRTDTIVWCVEIENIGEATLIDLTLGSDTLGLRTRDFTIIDGDLAVIEPGTITRAVIELSVDDGRVRRRNAIGGLNLDIDVEATPADDPERTLATGANVIVFADDEVALPGAADSFNRGVDVIATAGSVLLIVVAGLLPFLPIIALVVLGARFVRRRKAEPPTIEE